MEHRCKAANDAAFTKSEAYPFDFSVIIAVYNAEPFIREALDSIIGQTHPFSRMQMILVDDGSPDRSGEICDEYGAKYPDNIIVLHKENGGQASARMMAIPLAKGKYVNFFDPDDIMDACTFRRVFEFMEEHAGETDVCCIPMYFFGDRTGPHPFNNKFSDGCRVIDLAAEHTGVVMSCASSFFTNETAQTMDFDTSLITAEDGKELMKIMLRKQKVGVVCGEGVRYRYRKYRASTVGGAPMKPSWYLTYLEHFSQWALDYSKSLLGYVPRFVQYVVLYDLQWKYIRAQIPENVLSAEEIAAYQDRLFAMAAYFDDDLIMSASNLRQEHQAYLLYRKYGRPPQIVHANDGDALSGCYGYNGAVLDRFASCQTTLHFLSIEHGKIIVEGSQMIPLVGLDEPVIYAADDLTAYEAAPARCEDVIYSAGVPIAYQKGFRAEIPIAGRNRVRVRIKTVFQTFEAVQQRIVFGKHASINDTAPNSYFYKDGYMMTPTGDGLCVEKKSVKDAVLQELRMDLGLIRRYKAEGVRTAVCRLLVQVMRRLGPRHIWLITDQAGRADDNGEAFFRYLAEHKKEAGCRPVFAVRKDSPDYARLGKIGRVVPYMSLQHKLLHLLAEHTISSHAQDEVISPFMHASFLYADLLQRNKPVCLHHGVICHDLSDRLNRQHTNYALFAVSSAQERQTMLDGSYGYEPEQIILTGLPRYDYLYDNAQKVITLMPTWRRNLFGSYNAANSQWDLLPGFEDSEFYQFYNSLITSPRLLDAAEQLGYRIQLLPHPVLFPYADRFTPDPRVRVLGSDVRYRDVYAESSLVTTDFSSAVFDFVYLKKPVVYTQFDSNHYADGYFDYEKDGFGEVERTLESTIDRLIEYMQNGCVMKPVYLERVDKFFTYRDQNNSRRVLEKIKELDERSKS